MSSTLQHIQINDKALRVTKKSKAMNPFKNLSVKENEALLNFPVYITLLAANNDGILDEAEKQKAVSFAHTRALSRHPLITEFYCEVDKVFKNNLERLDKELPKEKDLRDAVISKKLIQLERIVLKLEREYSLTMNRSLKSFKEHVFKTDHNVLVDFIIPLPIPGLTVS